METETITLSEIKMVVALLCMYEFKIWLSHGLFDLEFLALSVHNGNRNIRVCLLYRPPSSRTTFTDNLYL